MKKITQIVIAFFLIVCWNYDDQKVSAQNLVPNPSFEDTVFCPMGLGQLYATPNWLSFGYTPDYFNACNNTGVSVPNSVFGFQYAHNGNGMAGLVLWRKSNGPTGPNTREYLAAELLNNLSIGVKYYFSCWVNFSYMPVNAVACNKFGMKLSTIPYDSSQSLLLANNFAHLFTDSIISDTVQWYNFKGSFIADSNYHYIILGNFFKDQQTDTLSFSTTPDVSYYYIDDVCLSIDSAYCENLTSLNNEIIHSINQINIFPVPTINKVDIESEFSMEKIELIDALGRIMYYSYPSDKLNTHLDLSNNPSGIYYIKIQTTDSLFYKKLIKN